MKPKPSKRRRITTGIPLNNEENLRFWNYINQRGFAHIIEDFLQETRLYLRGRCDGPNRSGTDPCGYVFISKDSFIKNHAPLLFFDPEPKKHPLKISFRKWKRVLPFSETEWKNLDDEDRLHEEMRIINLTSIKKIEKAISLAKMASEKFGECFDLSMKL